MSTSMPAAPVRQRKAQIPYSPGTYATLDQIGALLGNTSRATLYRLISKGILPKPKKVGGQSLFAPADVASIARGDFFHEAAIATASKIEADDDV